jgi:hypothetical protein
VLGLACCVDAAKAFLDRHLNQALGVSLLPGRSVDDAGNSNAHAGCDDGVHTAF